MSKTWHDFTADSNCPSSGQTVNETVFRAHLAELASDYEHSIWVAPQGEVTRYYLERQGLLAEPFSVTDNVIILNLAFEENKAILNEPLTLITIIPENWLNKELIVMQGEKHIDYTIDSYTVQDANSAGVPAAIAVPHNEPCLIYDVLPGSGIINIAPVTILEDIMNNGDLDSHYPKGVKEQDLP
jgi:hypothetical protein